MNYDRIPLCVLQGKLDQVERAIDAQIEECDPAVQLAWRSMRSPRAEATLENVSYFLRCDFDHLTRIVTQRQLAEYQRLMEEAEFILPRYINTLINAWSRLEGLL